MLRFDLHEQALRHDHVTHPGRADDQVFLLPLGQIEQDPLSALDER